MPKKRTTHKKTTTKKPSVKDAKKTTRQKVVRAVLVPPKKIRRRTQLFLKRRPHRSFQRTRRRDYTRSLKLPGYWSFTNHVRKTLWEHKKTFLLLVITYGLFSAVFVGIASQEVYTNLSDTLRETSGDIFEGNFGEVGKAGLLLMTGLTGSFNTNPTDLQRMYGVLFGLLVWLTTVWLLRAILAGNRPKLRDGLYNAGAPFISTFFVFSVLVLQLLPMALAAIIFGAGLATGFLDSGVEAMLVAAGLLLLTIISLYWITSSLIALVVVTLPGMYPLQAIKTAGDLVIGRRLRILFRLLWLFLITMLIWIAFMVPIILFDSWLKGVWSAGEWLPIVPTALLVVGVLSTVWMAAYIYLFYRKVVEDDARPA